LILNNTVPCGLFQDVCVPHKPNGCQCWLTFLHQTCFRSQPWTKCCPKESYPDRPVHTTFITTSHLVRFATCGHEHTVERGLAINFGN